MAEQPSVCVHDGGSIDFWSNIRLIPVRIISVENDTVNWKIEDKYEVRMGSFELTPKTVFSIGKYSNKPTDRNYFDSHRKSMWCLIYCDKCKKILEAYEI